MSEIRWIKITTSIFDDEKIRLIENLPDRDTIIVIWFKLLVLAGKCNAGGCIYVTQNIPYNEEMLQAVLNRPLNTIRMAIDQFKKFGMVQTVEDNHLMITNWGKHQSVEAMERLRLQQRQASQKQRDKRKIQELSENIKTNFEKLSRQLTGTPYFHDEREERALEKIIEAAFTEAEAGNQGKEKIHLAQEIIWHRATILYGLVKEPPDVFWQSQAFIPSVLATQWNRLIDKRQIIHRDTNSETSEEKERRLYGE